MIAKLGDGARVFAKALIPGELNDLAMIPDNLHVQRETSIEIHFTTTHTLTAGAAATVRLPPGLSAEGSVGVGLTVSSPDGSSSATLGIRLAGNMIQILNLVPE